MSRFWSQSVQALEPYVPGEQPLIKNLIKLNTNEHPLAPSPKVIEAIQKGLGGSLRLYPDPESTQLTQAIANYYDVSPKSVFVGNGSDEVLAHVFYALLKQSKPLYYPEITYGFYPTYCRYFDIEAQRIPLDDQLRIRPEDYFPTAECEAGAILIANPNAPTGHALSLAEIESILKANAQIPVVIDEAYVDFGAQSAVQLLDKYPNLMVVHTLSKSRSLAGLRVGFAMGATELIEGLERAKNSFNSYPLDRLAQLGATAAIEDAAYFEAACQTVIETRENLVKSLTELGFVVLPSKANFVFARHPNHDGGDLAAWLREQGILVRHFDTPKIRQYLRITVGTPEQCRSLTELLAKRIQA